MGLWGPLLELEDDLLRMKAISTVGSGLNLVRVRMLLASSYVTPIRDSLLMDTSWSPTCSLPSCQTQTLKSQTAD